MKRVELRAVGALALFLAVAAREYPSMAALQQFTAIGVACSVGAVSAALLLGVLLGKRLSGDSARRAPDDG